MKIIKIISDFLWGSAPYDDTPKWIRNLRNDPHLQELLLTDNGNKVSIKKYGLTAVLYDAETFNLMMELHKEVPIKELVEKRITDHKILPVSFNTENEAIEFAHQNFPNVFVILMESIE